MAKEGEKGLEKLEEEVRREEGIKEVGPDMTTKEAGKLGGGMVKKLIEEGKEAASGKESSKK